MRALKLTHDFDFVSNLFRTENRSASKMLETNMRKVAQDKKAVEILFLSKYVQSQDGRSLSEKTLENVNKEENLERRSENSTIFRRMRAIRRYENETNVDKSTSTTFFCCFSSTNGCESGGKDNGKMLSKRFKRFLIHR